MKKFIPIIVAVFCIGTLLSNASFAAFSSSISGKTKLFRDVLVYGTFSDATAEASANSIDTGLSAIVAVGATVTGETVASSTAGTGVKVSTTNGTIYITSYQNTTEAASQPDGNWWAIGR